jgi:hypothetical protein
MGPPAKVRRGALPGMSINEKPPLEAEIFLDSCCALGE